MPPGNARARWWRYSLPGIVLLGLALRLARLAFQPLWWDEGWSLYFATTSVGNMLQLTAVDIHPPLYYLLLHAWIWIFGSSPISVRALSVLIGTATIPLLYATGKRLFGERAGLLAALLLAISPFHIYYSQEVRMYGLVTLLGVAALYFAVRWEAGVREFGIRNSGLGALAGYVLTATAALYTQYYAAFVLLALNALVLFRQLALSRRGREAGQIEEDETHGSPPGPAVPIDRRGHAWAHIGSWLGAQIVVAVLYVPWLWYAGAKLVTYIRFKVGVEQYPPMGLFTYLGRHLAAFDWGHTEGTLSGWWWVGLLPLVLLVAVFALRLRRGIPAARDRGLGMGWWPLAILLVVLVCGFAVNWVFPFNPQHGERLLLVALPAYLLLFGAALASLGRPSRPSAGLVAGSIVALGVLSLGLFYTVPRYPDDDYRPVAARLQALALPTDAILCIHPWQVGYFEAYLPDTSRPALILTPREVLPRERQLWAGDPARMAADLDTLLSSHTRLWLPAHQAMGQILENQIDHYLAQESYPVLSEWHGKNTVLSLFAAGQPPARPVVAQFGDWLALEEAAYNSGPLQAGWDVVTVDLAWQTSERPATPYTVGLRLVGPTGDVWAQRDAHPGGGWTEFSDWPVGQVQTDHHGLLVPAGTPPGDYRIILQVYRSEDIAVLPATFEGGSGGEVTLGTVRVTRPEIPPPVQAMAFQHPLQVTFGNRLKLLGVNLQSTPLLQPGESIAVELGWQALADPGEDLLPRLQLVDVEGNVWAELTEKPVAGTYPTAWWQKGQLVRDPHHLPIPAAVPAGAYRLVLSLVRAADGQPVDGRGKPTPVPLAEIEVQGRKHTYEPVIPARIQAAQFGKSVTLVGYDLGASDYAPGEALEVTLVWRALATPGQNLYSFVHLLDGDGNIVAQDDGIPGKGTLPSLGWLPGEYISDPRLLHIPVDLPAGSYRLGVGLYDPATGARLGERVVLDTILTVTGDG